MIRGYKIATISVEIDSDREYFLDMLSGYELESEDYDMRVKMRVLDEITMRGELKISRDSLKVYQDGDIVRAYYLDNGVIYGGIAYDKRYCHAEVLLASHADLRGLKWQDIGYLLLGTLFNYKLTYYNGITLHGSAINYKGKAIIFTAPSGVGKSTQAMLWREVFGDSVSIINDDKPSLMIDGDKVCCFGTPFAGKHHLSTNENVPLAAIINVVRGPINKIERLGARESVVLLLEETTRSMLSQEININNMNIIGSILERVPIFRLQCTPTTEAVNVTYDAICEVL